MHDTAAAGRGSGDNGRMVVEMLDISDAAVAAQVLELQRAAYQVEADLVGSTDIPPLHESLSELMAASVRWRGIRIDDEIVAAIAFTQDGSHIDIDRLVVAPGRMRLGYGSALLSSLDPGAAIVVSTGSENRPACDFYLRHGFTEAGESEPVPGLAVTHFHRRPE